jgi:hypothetical protein
MPTTVLTFWLCLTGSTCDADHNVGNSRQSIEIKSGNNCEALFAEMLYTLPAPIGYVARHICISGDDL